MNAASTSQVLPLDSGSHSAKIRSYAVRACSYAAAAALNSAGRIRLRFCSQHTSTAWRHQAALFLDARTGFFPTVTNTGLVCDEG